MTAPTSSAPTRLSETEFSFPTSGERFALRTDPADPSVLGFDFHLEPGGGVPMVHCHLEQSEVFRCIEGVLECTVEGVTRRLEPGDELTLAPGTYHSLANGGDVEVHCEVEYRPAGRNREWFQLHAAFIDRTGREAGLLDMAPFLPDVDIYMKGPLLPQRLLLAWVLRPLGIVLGRRRRMLRHASEAYGRPFRW